MLWWSRKTGSGHTETEREEKKEKSVGVQRRIHRFWPAQEIQKVLEFSEPRLSDPGAKLYSIIAAIHHCSQGLRVRGLRPVPRLTKPSSSCACLPLQPIRVRR